MKIPGYQRLVDIVFPDIKKYLNELFKATSNCRQYLYNINDGYFIFRDNLRGSMIEISFDDAIKYMKGDTDLVKQSMVASMLDAYINIKYYRKQCIIGGGRVFNIFRNGISGQFVCTKVTLLEAASKSNCMSIDILDFLSLPLNFIDI